MEFMTFFHIKPSIAREIVSEGCKNHAPTNSTTITNQIRMNNFMMMCVD